MALTAVTTTSTVYSGGEVASSNEVTQSNTNTNATATGAANYDLSSGFNSITVPTSYHVDGFTLFPPSGNTTSITLKGITGDTGIRLHNTMASQIAINSSVTAIGITTGAAVTVRIAWW